MHEPAKAEPLLERAVRIEPFDPANRYRLGTVYRELGKTDESRRELAEFEKLKKMKSELSEIYQRMRLASAKPDQAGSETPQ
jgi:tetratricopeptide (TPR) repeat protein